MSCTHLWGRFRACRWQKKKEKKKTLLRNTFHFSLQLQCDSCWHDWVTCLVPHVKSCLQCVSAGWSVLRCTAHPVMKIDKMRRWTFWLHRWRFFSSRVHGGNTCMCYGLTSWGFESCHGYNVLIFDTHAFDKVNARKIKEFKCLCWILFTSKSHNSKTVTRH